MLLVKIGGDRALRLDFIAEDLAWLWSKKKGKLLVLHGASKWRNKLAKRLGVKVKKILSPSGVESYFSDKEFMEVFLMAYPGLVNKKLVAELYKKGVEKAVGLSGVDAGLFLARKKEFLYVKENGKIKLVEGDLSGKVLRIRKELLELLLENEFLPVLTVPAISEKGEILNVDNDAVVLELVKAFKIKVVISLISAPGLLQEFGKEESLIRKVRKEEIGKYFELAYSTMKKKLIYAQKYFEYGLEKMYIADGRVKHPIKRALEKEEGTIIF